MGKPTLSDVARRANVSPATASLVLSNKGKISDEVKSKVRTAAAELGYSRPSSGATGRAGTVAVLFHFDHELSQTWNILRQITLELERRMSDQEYLTILIPITFDMEDREIMDKIQASRARAVFSIHFGSESLFEALEDSGIPVVVIINSHYQSRFHTVCADNFHGSYEATSLLLELGHRRILYADFDIRELPETLSDRYFGFYKALDEHGQSFSEDQRLHLNVDDLNDIRTKLAAALSRDARPTAIFFVDDYLAARSYGVIEDLGLSIPRDLSIIASGEVLDYDQPYIPRISAMLTSPELLARFSAQMMVDRLGHKPRESYVLKIKQQLVDRGSCSAVPAVAPRMS